MLCYNIKVDSVHPPAVVGRKGPAVRRLKYYVSWVYMSPITKLDELRETPLSEGISAAKL